MSNSNKRVHIKYSIDLETLPEEVMRLLDRSNRDVKRAVDAYSNFNYTNVLSDTSVASLHELRVCLTKADAALEDVNSIINGYLEMKQAPGPTQPIIPAEEIEASHTQQEVPPPPYNPNAPRAQMMSNRPVGTPMLPSNHPFSINKGNKRTEQTFSLEQLQKTVKTVTDSMEGEESTDIQTRLKKISEALKNENSTESTNKTV